MKFQQKMFFFCQNLEYFLFATVQQKKTECSFRCRSYYSQKLENLEPCLLLSDPKGNEYLQNR